MATVTMIPARKTVGARKKTEDAPKLRVAAYCRVSTETDEQATSYEAQIEHYTEFIGNHPGWELAGIYADDGISGTNTKKREEFNRLIEDCMAGQVDMIVTKSISRFARNTLDCLKYIRQLKDKNIPVFFEKEAINTLDAKGEVLLTIMASLAQQESQSLSQNVRLGLQYRYQQGKVQVCTNRFLGYDKDEDGNLVINPEEAEVVKRIYREYLGGKSYYAIGQGLTADGIRTAAGNDYWLSIMWRTATRPSSRETFSCRFRRRWCAGPDWRPALESGGSTAGSTLCPTLFTALTAGTFSAGLIGRSEESGFRSGAASAGSRKEKQMWTAHHGLSTRRICTRRS